MPSLLCVEYITFRSDVTFCSLISSFTLLQCSSVCRLRGGGCCRTLAASVQPPPNVMTSSRGTLHTAGRPGAPAFRGVLPAPRHKPRWCSFVSFLLSPSLFLSLSAVSPPLSLCLLLFFRLLHFDLPALFKSLAVHLKPVFTAFNLWN